MISLNLLPSNTSICRFVAAKIIIAGEIHNRRCCAKKWFRMIVTKMKRQINKCNTKIENSRIC